MTKQSESSEDVKIGWVGDAHSGTLTCNVPGCGWEQFVETYDVDKVEAEHRASHRR